MGLETNETRAAEKPVQKNPLQAEGENLQLARGGKPSGPPNHDFTPGDPKFGPPKHEQWGWQNKELWTKGYDSSFFDQDPNAKAWKDNIKKEATNIVAKLGKGDGEGAARELKEDLYAMRGDMYGQNELLSQVNKADTNATGAHLQMGKWDASVNTWLGKTVVQPEHIPTMIFTYPGAKDRYPEISSSVEEIRNAVVNQDVNGLRDAAQYAYNNGILIPALNQLIPREQIAFQHFKPSEIGTGQTVELLSVNVPVGSSTGHINITTFTDADGKRSESMTSTAMFHSWCSTD